MIKTLRDFREALDKIMQERGNKKSGHIPEPPRTDDILVSSPDASATLGEISIGAIFVAPRSRDKRGQE